MDVRDLAASEYDRIIAADRALYPTKTPVTPAVVASWYRNNPEFGMIFERDGERCGTCLAIPLNGAGWEQLISGERSESQLDEAVVFNPGRDATLGLHIYHIEKIKPWPSGRPFHAMALSRLREIVASLRETSENLQIVGFSGFCVTAEGAGLFSKLGCRERGLVSAEHILRKNGVLEVFHAGSAEALRQKLMQGYEHVCRCQMLVAYPGEANPLWTYL